MWIYPVDTEDLAHPKQCPDCGAQVILAKTQTEQTRTLNAGFNVLQSISLGDGTHLQLVGREASHEATCEKKAAPGPPMTRKRRTRKNVDI